MGQLLSRCTVVENRSEELVELRECPRGDPEGSSFRPIVLRPNVPVPIPSREYHRRSIDSGIPRVIKLYCDGVCFETLLPQDFISNIELITITNNNGQMAVNRIRATPHQEDLFYIQALARFLRDIRG